MKLEVEEKQSAYDRKNQLAKTTWLSMQKMSLRLDLSEVCMISFCPQNSVLFIHTILNCY